MSIAEVDKRTIKNVIKDSIRRKLATYKPETSHKPFHYRLLGKDRMSLFSFIHSLNTTFGTSIFEPVAAKIAKERFQVVKTQVTSHGHITSEAQSIIQSIMDELGTAQREPNKLSELEELREVSVSGNLKDVKSTQIDLWLESNRELYLIDIKTAKPNAGNFKEFKRTLLEWAAAEFARNSAARVNTMIAIPYNPYYPKPYERWTMRGMFDLRHDLRVAEDFWNFLGGEGAYEDILDCFEEAGVELRLEIDEYFAKFKLNND